VGKLAWLWVPPVGWILLIHYLASTPGLRVLDVARQGLVRLDWDGGLRLLGLAKTRSGEEVARMGAHVLVYFVLGLLLYRALRLTCRRAGAAAGALTLVLGAVVAAYDELLQAGVPGRHSSVGDFALDLAGLALAWLVMSQWLKSKGRWLPS